MNLEFLGSSIHVFNTGEVHGNIIRPIEEIKEQILQHIKSSYGRNCKSIFTITNSSQGQVRERFKELGFKTLVPHHLQFQTMLVEDFLKMHDKTKESTNV